MPELPEVQTVVDQLIAQELIGRTIIGARVFWPKIVGPIPPADFCRRIAGHRIEAIARRGKYIRLDLDQSEHLLVHLRMTGRFNWHPTGAARGKHEHVVFRLDSDQELRFQDTRKFGRIVLTTQPDALLDKLGPEPLGRQLTAKRLSAMLGRRSRQIKPLLLDQTFVAGLGNIYVDEALWLAGIHPLQPANALTESQAKSLHGAIRKVLRQGLKNRGTSLGSGQGNFYAPGNRPGRNADRLNVFRRADQPCPRCAAPVQRIIVGQRSSHVCPCCQPRP